MKRRAAACFQSATGRLPNVRAGLRLCLLSFLCALAACSQEPYSITLMPTPAVLADKTGPAARPVGKNVAPHPGILYATVRPPAENLQYPYYLDKRGDAIRVGRARIEILNEDLSPKQVQAQALRAEREEELTLAVGTVEEYGLLKESLTPFSNPEYLQLGTTYADKRFAEAVDADLARSGSGDVVVYVHGYKVPFPDPVLVSAEFWHFLSYRGAFIAYSWPSTPSFWAYLSDIENAALSAHGFRKLLAYLSKSPAVDRIHVLGYSAGTRVVLEALHQIALIERVGDEAKTKLGRVALIGSDMDRGLFGMKLVDGIVDHLDGLTVYVSENDMALTFLGWFGFRDRTGQMWAAGEMPQRARDYLSEHPKLTMIDVTDAAGSTREHGHGYFRGSPWVSSDILATFLYGLAPADRGLDRGATDAVWRFPDDYPEQIRAAVKKAKSTSAVVQ